MANNKNLEKRKSFVKNDPRINKNGRPPKLVKHILKELNDNGYQRVTKTDISDTYETLLNLSQADLNDKAADKDAPMIIRIIAKEMLSSKGFVVIETMIDRAHGKATQKTETEISTKGTIRIGYGPKED